jgi:hypothetical protein
MTDWDISTLFVILNTGVLVTIAYLLAKTRIIPWIQHKYRKEKEHQRALLEEEHYLYQNVLEQQHVLKQNEDAAARLQDSLTKWNRVCQQRAAQRKKEEDEYGCYLQKQNHVRAQYFTDTMVRKTVYDEAMLRACKELELIFSDAQQVDIYTDTIITSLPRKEHQ